MTKVILQIPMNKDTRDAAEAVAQEQGFSSLQEVVRLFLEKFRTKKIQVTFTEAIEQLSPKALKRLEKMSQEIKSGKVKPEVFDSSQGIDKIEAWLNS